MTHEYSIVEGLVTSLKQQLDEQGIEKVVEIHFRRGSAFSEEVLRQAYQVLVLGTALEKAEVVIETINLEYTCQCGYQHIITSDDLIGHLFVCPECGNVYEVEAAHDLELITVIAEK